MSASPKGVCIPCRKVYKGNTERVVMTEQKARQRKRIWPLAWMGVGSAMHTLPPHCPECHGPLTHVWEGWRPPRRANNRAWKRMERGDWQTEKRVTDARRR